MDGGRPGDPSRATPSATERACIEMFRGHGVLLSPDVHARRGGPHATRAARRRPRPAGVDPVRAGRGRRGRARLDRRDPGHRAAAVRDPDRRATDAREAREGASRSPPPCAPPAVARRRSATRSPTSRAPSIGDLVDLLHPGSAPRSPTIAHPAGRTTARRRAPARWCSMRSRRARARGAGSRWRWRIPVWYVWDALYWHDRHNRHGRAAARPRARSARRSGQLQRRRGPRQLRRRARAARPGRLPADAAARGAPPRPCRIATLLELAARCAPEATARLAAELVPRALGDAPKQGTPAWPTDEAAWEHARRRLLALAACTYQRAP